MLDLILFPRILKQEKNKGEHTDDELLNDQDILCCAGKPSIRSQETCRRINIS
jgi:hypothetical protein